MKERFLFSLDHPVIRDHQVHGRHMLPGLAYIDLLYQVFKEHGHDYRTLVLHGLRIYHPLIVLPDQEILLDVSCSLADDSKWKIEVQGLPRQGSSAAGDRQLYITATMREAQPVAFHDHIDLAAVTRSAHNILELEHVYEACRRNHLVHGESMLSCGALYVTDDAVYVDARLPDHAVAASGELMFHPALIDGSAVCFGHALGGAGEARGSNLILPLSYESFRASALLQNRAVARIRRATARQTGELAFLTMEFFDASGQKVAELKNYAGKRVNEPDALDSGRSRLAVVSADSSDRHIEVLSSVTTKLDRAHDPSPTVSRRSVADGAAALDKGAVGRSLKQLLVHLVAGQLGIPEGDVQIDRGYNEMGLNSAGLMELLGAIEIELDVTLEPTLLFEYTSVSELSAYLLEQHPTKVDELVNRLLPRDTAGSSAGDESGSSAAAKAEQEQSKVHAAETALGDIAIIGMAGRFPQARDLREFWDNLRMGKDCITEVPANRWDRERLQHLELASGRPLSKWGGFLDEVASFDTRFFRISPNQADMLDPQERTFLEVSWEAIEDAGYTPKTLAPPRGRNQRRHVGVFVGVMYKDYALVGAEAAQKHGPQSLSLNYAGIPNRVSYFCNFHGPSIAVDTVCSSSLTALHLAVQSIRSGESDVAIAGGVNLSLHPGKYITCGMVGVHSTDGRCRTFGKGGDGYVSAEGVGAILLKPLRKALDDGDHVYAVVKGTSINHGGTVSGFTVPSPVAQAAAILSCLEAAALDPRTISYVEAHGTGTALGDPIEIQGLTKAFREFTADRQFCAIGSVKSNIGHAEAAAGISGLIKVALQLEHQTLVPSLHAHEPNPHINWQDSPFFLQLREEPWRPAHLVENGRAALCPRRASVSSFGASGSNAFVLLEEAPQQARAGHANESSTPLPVIVPLSARDELRLREYAQRLLTFIEHARPNLHDLAYTLQVGREPMEWRVAFVVRDIPELARKLRTFIAKDIASKEYFTAHAREASGGFELEHTDLESSSPVRDIAQLARLADQWVRGGGIDWRKLYVDPPRRISVPTYPFARVKHWIASPNGMQEAPRGQHGLAR